MKIKLPEHDHKLTNILKILLFSLLMLLPFLDIGTRCGYVLLNKNAYLNNSLNNTTNDVFVKIDDANNVLENFDYILKYTNETTSGYSSRFGFYYISLDLTTWDNYNPLTDYDIFYVGANGYIYVANNNDFANTRIANNIWGNTKTILFTSNGIVTETYNLNNGNSRLFIQSLSKETLDNVFDYSIDKMANSPLYNWTTQTGMYTGVNAMTTGLGITTPLFAILITYWMFLTIIYIILDIVLSLFTFMTHIFTKKE